MVARIRTTSSEKFALLSILPFLVTALTQTRKLGGILQFILSQLPLSLSVAIARQQEAAPNGIHNHSLETHEFHFPKQHFYFAGPRAIWTASVLGLFCAAAIPKWPTKIVQIVAK